MTAPNQESQVQENVDQKNNTKEYNFRALEAKYEKQLSQERKAREEAEKKIQELATQEEEEDSDYIDKKKLKREQAKFGQQIKQETQTEIQKAVHIALEQERQQNWLKQNSDFYDIMKHADKIPEIDSELADTILALPDTFERKKLVYRSIKAFGIHKPQVKEPSIQEKIDNNRKSPYYQPSGVGTGPYSQVGDFSPQGQKNAYEKMKQLQSKVRF